MNFLATPGTRKLLFTSLYLSEGGPIGFLWWALPTVLRSNGLPIGKITTLTAILTIPWALKFLWAPLVDVLRHRFPLKRWIIVSQMIMGVSLFPLLILDMQDQFSIIGFFLILHSFAAATQDVSIDALCIQVTTKKERGSLNGWMQAGMLTGRAILGGGALILMRSLGLPGVVLLLIGVVWFSMFLIFFTENLKPVLDPQSPTGFPAFRNTLRMAIGRRSTWYGLAFAAVAGAGYEAVGAVAGPFLIDRGLVSEEVGWFFLLPAVLATIGGSIVGGYVADRMQRTRAVSVFLLIMAGVVYAIAGVNAANPGSASWYLITFSLLYFSIGLFVSSSYALFMDITNPSLGATQFSAYMGATNLCESWSSFTVGRIIGGWGYTVAFLVMGTVSLVTLSLLPQLNDVEEASRPT